MSGQAVRQASVVICDPAWGPICSIPPSTGQLAPVTWDACGEARKAMTAAISRASPGRPSGTPGRAFWWGSWSSWPVIGVLISPGATQLAVMAYCPSSSAKVFIRPPRRSVSSSMTFPQSARSEVSKCATSALPPASRTSAAVSCAPSWSVCQVTPTSRPDAARATAVARPIPESEAVTMAWRGANVMTGHCPASPC